MALSYRFFRLTITRVMAAGVPSTTAGTRVAEFEIMFGATPYPTVNMTAANAPAPLVASASGDNGAGFEPWRAFDGVLLDTSRWISGAAPWWIQIDLGAGNLITPTGYRFAPDNAVGLNYYPLDWTLKGSDTGAFAGEEATLDTQTNVTTGWENLTLRSFPVTLPPSAATSITFIDINKKFLARDAWRKPWRTQVLSGTYTGGAPELFEYQVHRASDASVVQAWQPLTDVTIGSGNWSGTARIPQGGEHNISVRADADADLIVNGTFDFAVGLVVLALGQDNMAGLFVTGSGAPAASPLTYYWDGTWGLPGTINVTRLLNEVVAASGVPCAIMHASVVGASIDYALSIANGGTSSPADGSTGKTWDDWISTRIASMGEAVEFVVWHQGENGGDDYADKLNLIHQQVCAEVGRADHEVTFLVATINSGGSGHTAGENLAHNQTQTAILNARHQYPSILLSHSCYGCAQAGIQYTAAEQQQNAARFGRTIAAVLGDAQGHPIFEITHARTVDATTTDLFVRGGVATDFAGKLSPSSFTGFEVSGDSGATWAAPASAVRLNPTTIRVTHASLPTSSARRVRYGYGWDASIGNVVVDTSAYSSYLMPTPTPNGIDVAVAGTTQAHNGGKWQCNVFPMWAWAEFPFANFVKQGRISELDYSTVRPNHVDARGYALPGQSIRFVNVFLPPQAVLPGNYRLRWTGNASTPIAVSFATVVSGSLSGVDGEAILSIADPGLDGASVSYTADATNPISELSLVHVDYCASYDSGNPFNPKYLEVLAECRPGTLRFLDWINPNSPYAKWEHRKPLDYSIWSDQEYRGSEYLTTTNVGNAFTTSGSGGVLTHGQLAIILLSGPITAPTNDATLNWKGTGAKPLRETSTHPFGTLTIWSGELPIEAGTYHCCVYDAVLDMWLMDVEFGERSYPLMNGAPPELIFDLCNRVGANCWIPIPFVATEPLTDYIPKLGALAREKLKPWLKLFTEPGNEWWNIARAYVCTQWATSREVLRWGPPSGNPAYHEGQGYRYYNLASANVGRTLAAIFGNDRQRFATVSATIGVASVGQTVEQAYTENMTRYMGRVKGENYYEESGEYAQKWVTHVCTANYWSGAHRGTPEETTLGTEYTTATPTRKAEILNEYSLGPIDPVSGLHHQYSGLPPLEPSAFTSALQWDKDLTYDTWGQIAAENGHGLVAYEGGCWEGTEVAIDAKNFGTAMRDLQRFDMQNWLDAGGTFPSQYWLSTPRWNLGLLTPSIYAADSPAYLGLLDFNAGVMDMPEAEGLLTELGDHLMAESGDALWTEGDDPVEPPGEAFTLTTESGDVLVTESGDTMWTEGDIPVEPPGADFTGAPLSGTVPLLVNFTNTSTGDITSHSWTFGDGGTSTAASPSHTYTVAGNYTVTLTETGPGGSNTRTRTSYIAASAGTPVGESDTLLTESGDTLTTEGGDTLMTEGEESPVPGDALLYVDLEARIVTALELEARFTTVVELEARFNLATEVEVRMTGVQDT